MWLWLTLTPKALLYANNDGRYRILSESTIGLVFFGTPHKGSEKFRYGTLLNKLANALRIQDHSIATELERDGDTLAKMSIESNKQLSKYIIVSCYGWSLSADVRHLC